MFFIPFTSREWASTSHHHTENTSSNEVLMPVWTAFYSEHKMGQFWHRIRTQTHVRKIFFHLFLLKQKIRLSTVTKNFTIYNMCKKTIYFTWTKPPVYCATERSNSRPRPGIVRESSWTQIGFLSTKYLIMQICILQEWIHQHNKRMEILLSAFNEGVVINTNTSQNHSGRIVITFKKSVNHRSVN